MRSLSSKSWLCSPCSALTTAVVFSCIASLSTTATAREAEQQHHLVVLVAEREYKTAESLPVFAREHLGDDFRITFVKADPEDKNRLVGLDAIKTADVLLVSVRRRTLPEEQLAAIRKFVEAGKPVVGIRTASHAFSVRDKKPPAGSAVWPEFDRDVLGGNYRGHHGNKLTTFVKIAPDAASHPILSGVAKGEFKSGGSLYRTSPVGDKAKVLMTGTLKNKEPDEPVAWTNKSKYGGRVFYTSLGHVGDFKQPAFQRLIANGIYWAADLPIPKADAK